MAKNMDKANYSTYAEEATDQSTPQFEKAELKEVAPKPPVNE